eukprot:312471-Amphidinium_carterae.1
MEKTKNGKRPFLKKNPLLDVLFFFPMVGRPVRVRVRLREDAQTTSKQPWVCRNDPGLHCGTDYIMTLPPKPANT